MTLNEQSVWALKAATKIAMESGRLDVGTQSAMVQDLYERACDALENWTYDPTTATWSVKR